jgi:multidrug efflux pump subunit AcrB
MLTLIEGAALAVLVVFIFLRDMRATIISAVALPLSIIPTFWAMDMMGFSLNLVSLLAITLVTGILVDDAIVEIENIVRHMRMGKSPYRAAMEAADEIGLAVIAITFTIVAIFAPVSFMGGVAGQYFKQFGLTVAVSVLFSLLVARLITPMMAAYFMRPTKHVEAKDGWLMRRYLSLLRFTVRFRFLTLIAGFAVFGVSIWSTSLLPTGFIPPEDSSRIVLSIEMAPGVTLETMNDKTDDIVTKLKVIPEVTDVFAITGSSPTGSREVRKAALFINLTPKNSRDRSQKVIEGVVSEIVAGVPDIRAWYVNERGERELAFTIAGTDPVALADSVAKIEAAMRRVPSFSNVAAVTGVDRPEIRVSPRQEDAARFGISTDAISEAVRVATIGDVGPALPKFNAGDRLIPIRVQLEESARHDLRLIKAMTITGTAGIPVPLEAVADVDFGQGPSSIDRYNRVRRAVIGADLVGGMQLGEALELIEQMPEVRNLPAGVYILRTGDAEIQQEVFSGFAKAMGLGIVIVLCVLVLLFHDVFQPITILLSLPLSIGGVILALLITNNPISMPVVIGILMLMGIVTKNAIMLVDFAVEEQAKGVPRTLAIIDAGRKRARPIIMTTIAMAAGMLPSAYGVGEGGEFRAPMAIGVIGGLIVSTVLSLVFVPAFFTIMDDVSRLFGRMFGRFVGPKEDETSWLSASTPHGAVDHAQPPVPAASRAPPRLAAE